MDSQSETGLKTLYLRKAIREYEYSPAPEYEKPRMSPTALDQGTLDFDYHNAEADVDVAPDGAWVRARVWVPKGWLDSD
jgi:hypothetical protein